MELDSRIKLGLTVDEVKAIYGEPSMVSNDQNPLTLVFGEYDCDNGDYLEMVFYSEKPFKEPRRLCQVMQMVEHERLLPPVSDEERERDRKLREEWAKEDAEAEKL